MFTDSHCHLTFPELASQWPDISDAMKTAQVTRALCICTTLEEFPTVQEFAVAQPHIWATVGVHPDNEGVREPDLERLLQWGSLPKIIAIGETGLDYYRLGQRSISEMEWQRERFRVHIEAARKLNKPLVIHTRSASDDTLAILKEAGECGDQSSAGGFFTALRKTWMSRAKLLIWASTFHFLESLPLSLLRVPGMSQPWCHSIVY